MTFYRLSDIKIHIIADADNQSDMYIYQNSTYKIVILKTLENNVIRVYKTNFPINWPTITDTNTTKMSPI